MDESTSDEEIDAEIILIRAMLLRARSTYRYDPVRFAELEAALLRIEAMTPEERRRDYKRKTRRG